MTFCKNWVTCQASKSRDDHTSKGGVDGLSRHRRFDAFVTRNVRWSKLRLREYRPEVLVSAFGE